MPRVCRTILQAALALGCGADMALSQEAQPVFWEPVDQTVADLDLRAVSSRHVEQGIGVFGQSGSLYHRSDTDQWQTLGQPLSHTYQLRRPGYTAYIDRPDYLVVDLQGEINLNVAPSDDGNFLNLVPPNTVFDLVYRPATPTPVNDAWLDGPATSTRIDGQFHGRVTGEPTPSPLLFQPVTAHRLPDHLLKAREARRAEAEAEAEKQQAEEANEDHVEDEATE